MNRSLCHSQMGPCSPRGPFPLWLPHRPHPWTPPCPPRAPSFPHPLLPRPPPPPGAAAASQSRPDPGSWFREVPAPRPPAARRIQRRKKTRPRSCCTARCARWPSTPCHSWRLTTKVGSAHVETQWDPANLLSLNKQWSSHHEEKEEWLVDLFSTC